jgi:urea transporter
MTPAARTYLWNLFRDALLHGYSQIFFSLDRTFGIVLLIVSFTDPYVALSGLSAGLLANFAAYAMGYDHKGIREGMYSFNSIMMGMMMANRGWMAISAV